MDDLLFDFLVFGGLVKCLLTVCVYCILFGLWISLDNWSLYVFVGGLLLACNSMMICLFAW